MSDDRALVRSISQVKHAERHARNRHVGAVVWLTGLSASGKSTLANMTERALFDRGMQTCVLDGDNVRFGLNRDLGFSAEDRAENIRRIAEVAKIVAELGFVVVTAFISPYRHDRDGARRIMGEGSIKIPFIEVFVDAPLEVCERRDPKGLYVRARAGEIKQFTGVSDPYESPERPEIHLATGERSAEDCLGDLLGYVLERVNHAGA